MADDVSDNAGWGTRIFFMSALLFFIIHPIRAIADFAPEEDPPTAERILPAPPPKPPIRKAEPTEWTYHKTADDLHPNGFEQQQMWLMNRARQDPAAEGEWLAVLDDPYIVAAVDYFNVDIDMLKAEFNAYPAQPPGAFDVRLYYAAYAHCEYLIQADTQSHTGQFERINAAGFVYNRALGSVFSYAEGSVDAHASFNIDYGYGEGGMQDGRGHRMGTMSLKPLTDGTFASGDYYNVGVAVIPENNQNTRVGPYVVTENFARAYTAEPDHYNRFIVGTVWEDSNDDGMYSIGEGEGVVTVTPINCGFFAATPPAGGFAVPVTAQAIYDVRFTGEGLPFPITRTVTVKDLSVLVDLKAGPDRDGDNLLDSFELDNFPHLSSTDGSGDADSDNLSDRDEFRYMTDPNQKDTDGDLMDDGWEVQHELNPLADDGDEDPDQDVFSNEDEYRSKTDPSLFTIVNPGDVNQNGALDMSDALFAIQVEAQIHEIYTFPVYDIDGDGKLGVSDGVKILKALAGMN